MTSRPTVLTKMKIFLFSFHLLTLTAVTIDASPRLQYLPTATCILSRYLPSDQEAGNTVSPPAVDDQAISPADAASHAEEGAAPQASEAAPSPAHQSFRHPRQGDVPAAAAQPTGGSHKRNIVHQIPVFNVPIHSIISDQLPPPHALVSEADRHQQRPQYTRAQVADDGYEPQPHESSDQETVSSESAGSAADAPAAAAPEDSVPAPVDAIDLPLDEATEAPADSDLQSPGQQWQGPPQERLVPVLTFSGAPAHQLIQRLQQVKPDPRSVPQITRKSIQANPSLTVRQKSYLSKVLDDYYRFIVDNVKSKMRRRHLLVVSKKK